MKKTTPLNQWFDEIQDKLYREADELVREFRNEYMKQRQANPKEKIEYSVVAKKGEVGIEITWSKRKFVKARTGMLPHDNTVKLGTKRTLSVPHLKAMPAWQRELVMEIEPIFCKLGKRSDQLINISRSMKYMERMMDEQGFN